MVLKANDSFMRKSENDAKGIMFQFTYENAWREIFDDPNPALE